MKRKHKINFQEYISHGTQHLLKENYSLFLKKTQSDLSFDAYVLLEYLNNLFSEIEYLIGCPGEIQIGLDWLKERRKEYAALKNEYLDIGEATYLATENITMLLNIVSDKIESVEQKFNTIALRQKKFLKYA